MIKYNLPSIETMPPSWLVNRSHLLQNFSDSSNMKNTYPIAMPNAWPDVLHVEAYTIFSLEVNEKPFYRFETAEMVLSFNSIIRYNNYCDIIIS